jgi:hypothetical protein
MGHIGDLAPCNIGQPKKPGGSPDDQAEQSEHLVLDQQRISFGKWREGRASLLELTTRIAHLHLI